MIFTLECEADLYTERTDFVSSDPAPRKFILKIFKQYFVVCPVELQGINNMLICIILVDHGHGWSTSVTMIMPSSSVTRSMDCLAESDFLVSFLQG